MEIIANQDLVKDLQFDFLNSKKELLLISDDILRLLKTSDEDFQFVKQQSWYQRLWHTFGGANLQKVGSGCANVAQAQSILVELLRLTARNHSNGMQLMTAITEDLDHMSRKHGELIGHIANLYQEIKKIKGQLDYQHTQVIDENELPEEMRVLILRAMIVAAYSDGEIQPEEIEMISQKVESLCLSEKARRIINQELKSPTPIEKDLKNIDSYKLRFHIYRNIVAVVFADGVNKLKEQLLMTNVAKYMQITDEDIERCEAELSTLIHKDGLKRLIDAIVVKFNMKEEEEFSKKKAQEDELMQQQFSLIIDKIAESYVATVGIIINLAINSMQAPLLDIVHRSQEAKNVQSYLDSLNTWNIKSALTRASNDSIKKIETIMDLIILKAFPFLENNRNVHFSRALGGQLEEKVSCELERNLRLLKSMDYLEERLRKCDKGFLEFVVSCGAVGFVLGALTGGLGVLLGMGGAWLLGDQKDEENAQLFENYHKAFIDFCESNDEAMRQIYDIIMGTAAEYFDNVLIPALSDADAEYDSLKDFLNHLMGENTKYEGELKLLTSGQ